VPAIELESVDEVPRKQTYTLLPVAPPVPKEIHLRGLRVEDAKYELQQYLDLAVEAGLDEIRVVHGKGTGAVRQATQELLRRDSRVASIRAALPAEGGDGATIALLKT
jgi:DNA mismatch repair protein MutS2